ncbi:hypothetical protein DSO57_1009503 [Entomophthora muscae]|uniref:Uncharacterized protein n=1 Tax=Entomophthora muscae TaxID=34485 RepID=A0ACC2US57_9FUNG|nr:hypothetical protein DSO57_1009503 [Entomophthora muscae]
MTMALHAVCGSALDDVRRLNFALEIENAKNALFDSQVAHGAKPGTFSSRALMRIGDHTKQYQSMLATSIKDAGGEPYTPCEYEFKPKDEKEFLDTIRGLETIGVQMNVGLVAEMAKAKYRLELARILTTQGRHLAYVNQLAGIDPYPDNSEDTVAPEQAMAYLQNFVKACPRTRESNYHRLSLHPSSGPPGSIIMFTMPYFHRGRANNASDDRMPIRRPYCTFMHSQRQVFVASHVQNRCKVPRDMPFGLTKVYITSARRPISSQYDSHVMAGPALFDVRGSSMLSPPFPYPESSSEMEDLD